MEEEKNPVKKTRKKSPRSLSEADREQIYKEEKKRIQKKKNEEITERSTVVFGNILLPLYIFFSSLIISVASTVYVVMASEENLRDGFVNTPFGVTADLAFIAVTVFVFWLFFGFVSFLLFLRSDRIVNKKPELAKKMNIFNWRKI